MSEQTKKPGFFSGITRWLRELKSEIKKIVWPTGKQVWNNTLIVIISIVLVGVFIWAIDFIFEALRNLLMLLA